MLILYIRYRAGKSKNLICWKRLKGGKRRKRRLKAPWASAFEIDFQKSYFPALIRYIDIFHIYPFISWTFSWVECCETLKQAAHQCFEANFFSLIILELTRSNDETIEKIHKKECITVKQINSPFFARTEKINKKIIVIEDICIRRLRSPSNFANGLPEDCQA